jgi:hypothetical protein
MPIRYLIDKKLRLVITIGSDCVTFTETRAHQDQLLSDPDFDPEYNQQIDLTGTTMLDMTVDEARTIASRKIFSSTSKRAFIASSPSIFGMGRLMQAYHEMAPEPSQARVFYDRDAAMKWLGLETPPRS